MKTTPAFDIIVTDEDHLSPETIRQAYRDWDRLAPRYETLWRYYMGMQDFDEARASSNRIVSNYCAYISEMLRGYMVGNRPKYVCGEEDSAARDIIDLYVEQSKWTVDSQIVLDMSRYGRAFELVYLPKGKDIPNSVPVSPRNAFVAYAGDMERDSVFGAVIFHHKGEDNAVRFTMYVYTRTDVSVWTALSKAPDGWTRVDGPTPHGFGRVPLIEYRNNWEMKGDYEGIMDLQDAYNALQSDRQDDKDAFNSANLVLKGLTMGESLDQIKSSKEYLKESRVITLPEDSDVSWLVKTLDESAIQVLQDHYARDIHKFAMVPDLSDEQFAGNASGVAMAYKMFGTDQMMAEKVSRFRDGYIRRTKLYDWRLNNPTDSPGYSPSIDLKDLDIIFAFNTPQDINYVADAVTKLTSAAVMSKRTARMMISTIPDPEAEGLLVEEEARADSDRMAEAFENDDTDTLARFRNLKEDDEDGDTEEMEDD